jgi:hypothetical protein
MEPFHIERLLHRTGCLPSAAAPRPVAVAGRALLLFGFTGTLHRSELVALQAYHPSCLDLYASHVIQGVSFFSGGGFVGFARAYRSDRE